MIMTSIAMAQDISALVSSDIVNINQGLNSPQLYQDDEIYLQQAGYNHRASITQFSPFQNGNSAYVRQFGGMSNIDLTQIGKGNSANYGQYGLKNSIHGIQMGNDINTGVFQFGYENRVLQELGSDGMNYSIIQMGNKHEVIDRGFSPNNPGYTIKQSGLVGMKVDIQHHQN
jgi:hypothetical protein